MNDTDEKFDTAEIEEEDWIEYMKRSIDEAIQRMETSKIQCWIKPHKRINEMETGDENRFPEERWLRKQLDGTLNSGMKYKTYEAVGRPRKRWEDEINDFLSADRIENALNNAETNNNGWIKTAKDLKVLDENGKQVHIRDSSSTWLLKLV